MLKHSVDFNIVCLLMGLVLIVFVVLFGCDVRLICFIVVVFVVVVVVVTGVFDISFIKMITIIFI